MNGLQVSEMLVSDRRSLEPSHRKGSFTELRLVIKPMWPSDVNIFVSWIQCDDILKDLNRTQLSLACHW